MNTTAPQSIEIVAEPLKLCFLVIHHPHDGLSRGKSTKIEEDLLHPPHGTGTRLSEIIL